MTNDLHSQSALTCAPRARIRPPSWRVWLPGLVLILVAMLQVVLAKTAALSPWKGGGFGMFSSNDGAMSRYVRLFVEAYGRSEEIGIASSQEFAAGRVQLYPSDTLMTELALAVMEREQRYDRPVNKVRVELWRTEYDPVSLTPRDRQIGNFDWYVDQGDNRSGR